jgi:hypothetical protein
MNALGPLYAYLARTLTFPVLDAPAAVGAGTVTKAG